MKETKLIMGMPITVEVIDKRVNRTDLAEVFNYFEQVDKKFSTYKEESETSKINRGEIGPNDYSDEMKSILDLCEKTKKETGGYFDIYHENKIDPSGLVKGWAIQNAAKILKDKGFKNYFVDAGGDMQIAGLRDEDKPWQVGIRNPFNRYENVKVIRISDEAVATSGTYIRGQHVYNPLDPGKILTEVVSLTVIGRDILDADRYATAAFAMQKDGLLFIERLDGFEGYMINKEGRASWTSGFKQYVLQP